MTGIDCAFMATVFKAEAKTSAAGRPYLRINCRIGDADAAQWVNVLAFDNEAIAQAEKFIKDARVYVEGKLSLSEYQGKDGTTRTGITVMAHHCRLPQIGKNRPRKEKQEKPHQDGSKSFYADGSGNASRSEAFLSDDLPF